MRLTVLDHFPPELDSVAERSPQATFYHSRVWAEILSRVYPSWAFRCIVAEEGNDILGYLPFFVIRKGPVRIIWSMPFGTYGGPVTLDSEQADRALLQSFTGVSRGFWIYETAYVDFLNRIPGSPFTTWEQLTHIIDLGPGFDVIWSKALDKSKRKQSKRAERMGVRIVETGSAQDAAHFYAIYASRMKASGGKIHYPERLFVDLVVKGGDCVKLFLAYHDEELLGGQLNFYFKDTVIAWYGITTLESRMYQASAGLYTFCIRHACAHNFKRFNLGGSMGKTSLIDYKMSFGAVPHRYSLSIIRSPIGRIAAVIKKSKASR